VRTVLLTGATGYVGGRLLEALEARDDLRVRCLSRRPADLRPEVAPGTEVVEGDLLEPETLGPALRDADAAYYLVHSMGEGADFEELDRRAAENFARAAREEGVRRIVYLGGLGEGDDLSRHLRSRQEVGRILRESGVPTLELRASVVIGAGSLSFEMIRALVERLPVMVLPRWVRRDAQPIAVDDVVAYLLRALEGEAPASRVYQIGGADRVSYEGMMREYARQRGLRRLMIPVPVLTPWLSGLWLGLVTPVYARVGRKLASSLVHDTVVTDDAGEERFGVDPVGVRAAVARALEEEDRAFERVRWSRAARDDDGSRAIPAELRANRYVDSRARRVPAPPERAFAAVRSIGPSTGGPVVRALWGIRRGLDRLVGGPASADPPDRARASRGASEGPSPGSPAARGRAAPAPGAGRSGDEGPASPPSQPGGLAPGNRLDIWRVERVELPRVLRLRAEMRLPGRAWLQLEVDPDGDGSLVTQTAIFDPKGVGGRLYWWALHPVHAFVFERTLRGLCRQAAEG
jgi:uncharacterized protein YbjT (DUF2867 family)